MPRVLVVDDEESVRSYLKTILTAEGYEVLTARDGLEAIRVAEREPLSAILLDLMMPNLSGETALRTLKEMSASRDVPVVVITAKQGDESVVEATVAGADAYLTKPFEPAVVFALLRRLIDSGEENTIRS